MSLKSYEMAAASSVTKELVSIVKESDASVSVDLLGSYCSGLATPTSDLDLRIFLPSYEKDPLSRGPSPRSKQARKAGYKSLLGLQRALERGKSFHQAYIKPGHRAILDAIHCSTELRVQIQFEPTPQMSLPYIASYLSEFPTLRPLFILLRSALHIRGLNDVWTGGLGSYAIFIMIVYALKQSTSELPRYDIASQLLYILKIYSEFDFYKYGLSLDPPRTFDKSIVGMKENSTARLLGIDRLRKASNRGPFFLCLQDPADPSNDLGISSYGIKHVKAVFCSAREEIEQATREWEAMEETERKNVTEGCLDPLVGASYAHFERRRKMIKQKMAQTEEFSQDLSEEKFSETRMFEKSLGEFLIEPRQTSSPEAVVPYHTQLHDWIHGVKS